MKKADLEVLEDQISDIFEMLIEVDEKIDALKRPTLKERIKSLFSKGFDGLFWFGRKLRFLKPLEKFIMNNLHIVFLMIGSMCVYAWFTTGDGYKFFEGLVWMFYSFVFRMMVRV